MTSNTDDPRLHFYVNDNGEPVFLERLPGSWSDVVAKRARRPAVAS